MADAGVAKALGAWVRERFPLDVSVPLAVVLCGATLPPAGWGRLPGLAAVGWLLLLAARAWDDLADVARDRVRRPERVLPSGRLPARLLFRAAIAAAALGLAGAVALSLRSGAWAAACIAIGLSWYAARPRLPALLGPPLVNLVFPALVLLGPIGLGVSTIGGLLVALFAWTGAVAHDLGHGIEEEAGMPPPLRDPLSPRIRARWGVGFFVASLVAAAASEIVRPDPLFGAIAAAAGLVVASRFASLLRKPSEWNGRRLRVAGFVYFVAPLVGAMVWSLLG
jgi:4-hydroxybenzoate polyprenyltransferase